MKLTEARKIAEKILRDIRKCSVRAEIAGSIRREKSEVKDIEIVAVISDYNKLFRLMKKHGQFIKPGVPDIIPWEPHIDAKYLRLILNEGIKLDLFIPKIDNWGAIYCMRTGSGVGPNGSPWTGFIPAMFSQWKRVSGGGKMVEGYPTTPEGEKIKTFEEEDFFNLLGVKFVDPKDRIDAQIVKKSLIKE